MEDSQDFEACITADEPNLNALYYRALIHERMANSNLALQDLDKLIEADENANVKVFELRASLHLKGEQMARIISPR